MSDFVLVLLVKGREPFTERWLEYMSKINFKYKIAIGNGNKKSDKYIKKLINKKKYSNLNIEYYSYNNKNYKDYYYMMYDVVRKQKKTKFIKFCDNDDFILPFQLENLIKLIKKDKKSISIGDRCMWFSLIGNKIYNKKFCVGGSTKSYTSLKDLTIVCEKVTGNKIKFKRQKKTSIYDIPYYLTDNSYITKTYKWSPKKNIMNIVKDTYKWLIENKKELIKT